MIWGNLSAILMGTVLGLIGGGGSILTVPILVYFFQFPGTAATYHSLFIVGVCAAIGVIPFSRRGLVRIRTALIFLLPAILGVRAARRWILPAIPNQLSLFSIDLSKDLLILVAFAIVMVIASVAMIHGNSNREQTLPIPDQRDVRIHTGILGLGVGLLTGFVGAGGGFLIVPSLVHGLRLPIESAVGTSLLIIALNSLSGFLGDWLQGVPVHWKLILPFTTLAMGGIFLGTYLNRAIPATQLKRGFGWFVLVVGTFMLGQQILALTMLQQ